MLNMTVTSILAFIGIVLFFIGLTLVLAGFKIADLDKLIKVIDRQNPLTWKAGFILIVIGIIFLYPQIRRETSPLPTDEVTIALTNAHCEPQDYYVDSKLIVSVEAESTIVIKVKAGVHWVQACRVGSSTFCGEAYKVNWISATEDYIVRGASCPIVITINNNHCQPQDYYVDDILVASIEPEGIAEFKIRPGEHFYQVCLSGTKTCTTAVKVNWTSSISEHINRGTSCE